jgi:hypothetical protein
VAPPGSWPAIASGETRWRLRAAIDAVVAQAFGLGRADYSHILDSFAHKHFPLAPTLCLAAFDALTAQGLDAFCHAHDPYDDIALVSTLALPVDRRPARQPGESAAA